MRDVHCTIPHERVVMWTYGCVRNFLDNLCEDMRLAIFMEIIEKHVYVSKNILEKNWLQETYEIICAEKCGKVQAMILYCKTKWPSIKKLIMK